MPEDKSYLERYFDNSGEDRVDRITIPSYEWGQNVRRVDEEPLFMDVIQLGLSNIRKQITTDVISDDLEKYFKVAERCNIFGFNWSSKEDGNIRVCVAKDEDDNAALFVLEVLDSYVELRDICFGKYRKDKQSNRVIDVEFWVNMKEFQRKLNFNPLFPWQSPLD